MQGIEDMSIPNQNVDFAEIENMTKIEHVWWWE